MLLQRIRARNYRTYLDLDLDLSVTPDRPLLLIGGKNGGGKTTLFSAISGALYGLRITDTEAFRQEMNAGALAAGVAEPKIELELAFSGQILAQVQQYVITRTWVLSSDGRVNWGVKLNMAGNVFAYGSASGDKERQAAESQVAKIVKANLPRELSEYFLFDAMNAGQKLSEDQLGRSSRENIGSSDGSAQVPGSRAGGADRAGELARRAHERQGRARRIPAPDRGAAQRRVAGCREANEHREMLADQLHGMKRVGRRTQDARSKEDVARHRLEAMEKQQRDILTKEALYRERLDEFVKVVEPSIALSQLAKSVAGEVAAIREAFAPAGGADANLWTADSVGAVVEAVLLRLSELGLPLEGVDRAGLVVQLLDRHDAAEPSNRWAWLEPGELRALEELVRSSRTNPFPSLDQLRRELALSIDGLAQLDASCEDLRRRIAGDDYGMIQKAETLEKEIGEVARNVEELQKRLAERGRRIHQYDVRPLEEPDPR
ncbi:MAG: AAA family ATPase, partial [Fibrobacteres bacterium]|nr:AAA family ATPase [Fibrobacterota bacterium]